MTEIYVAWTGDCNIQHAAGSGKNFDTMKSILPQFEHDENCLFKLFFFHVFHLFGGI